MPGVRIVGIGHYSPDNCISNDYLASIVDKAMNGSLKEQV